MKSLIVEKWILKASGLFEADSMFLVEKGACAVVKDIVFHLGGEIGHVPKCVANAFVYVWKYTLVARIVPCFGVGITQSMI